jgi:hypothetical protein
MRFAKHFHSTQLTGHIPFCQYLSFVYNTEGNITFALDAIVEIRTAWGEGGRVKRYPDLRGPDMRCFPVFVAIPQYKSCCYGFKLTKSYLNKSHHGNC